MPPLPIATPGPFPAELADRRQWLVWRFVQKPGQKKPSKMPYYATTGMLRGWPLGKPKEGTPTEQQPQVDQGHELDREHLVDHDTAQAFAARHHFDGVGFAFLPGDGLIGIDLDEIDLDETRSARAASIIKACATWCEWSPSGRGVHLIGLGESHTAKSNDIGVELFVGRQFFTMTGNTHPASADDVRQIGAAALEKLHRTIQKAKDDAKPAQPPAPAPGTTAAHNADASRYCLAALESAVQRMRGAGEGTRNDTLNAEVYGLAQLIHTGGISEATIRAALTDAAIAAGLPPGEVTATVASGINGGQRNPRVLPERQHQPRPQRPAPLSTVDPDTGEILDAPPAANDNAVRTSGHDLAAVDWYSPFPDTNAKGKAIGTIENVREAARRLGVTIRYNVIRKDLEILIPGTGFSIDNNANASLAWFTSACIRFGVPTSELQGYLTFLADQNLYNPVAEWIASKPWDGRSRLQALCNTIKAEGEADDLSIAELKEALIRRWMISAVAAAFNPTGVSAHGVLVLQGDQYLGKTKWFKGLVPAELGVIQDGLTLKPDDKDSVKNVVRNWLVELGELDATFRKSDIAMLKSFLTKDRDVLRKPFDRRESEFARRTVFFASVNPRQFLHDPTGNRRYWTISCASIDHDHGLDMQQVWAEVHAEHYDKGESWYLTPDEMAGLNGLNREHEVLDPIRERIMSRLDWDAPALQWRWMTATDVMSECGFDRPTRADVTQAGLILQELNGKRRKTVRGRALAMVPPRLPASGV